MKHYLVSLSLLIAAGSVMAAENNLPNLKPTAEMIAEAKNTPNGWVYAIDGNYSANENIPSEAIPGAWQVDEQGKIIEGSFRANPNYKKK